MPPRLPRRLVLAGALTGLVPGLAATGCGTAPGSGARSVPEVGSAGEDVDVVDEAVALADSLGLQAAAAVRRHPSLEADLTALRALHAEHTSVLAPDRPDEDPSGGSATAPARPGFARRRLLAAEREAVASYAGLVGRASSGALAATLAAAAAGIAQQLAVLDPDRTAVLPAGADLTGGVDVPGEVLDAAQLVLAAEHAAVWVLAFVGGRTSVSALPAVAADLAAAYGEHLARRDELSAALAAAGAEPLAAEPSYRAPQVPAGEQSAGPRRRSGRDVEERCAAAYRYLVAGSTGTLRDWATRALADAAVRSVALGADPTPLPGGGRP